MGKGDKKSRRGKLFNGSFGKRRPRKKTTSSGSVKPASKKAAIRKEVEVEAAAVKEIKAAEKEEKKSVVEKPAQEEKSVRAEKTVEKKPTAPRKPPANKEDKKEE